MKYYYFNALLDALKKIKKELNYEKYVSRIKEECNVNETFKKIYEKYYCDNASFYNKFALHKEADKLFQTLTDLMFNQPQNQSQNTVDENGTKILLAFNLYIAYLLDSGARDLSEDPVNRSLYNAGNFYGTEELYVSCLNLVNRLPFKPYFEEDKKRNNYASTEIKEAIQKILSGSLKLDEIENCFRVLPKNNPMQTLLWFSDYERLLQEKDS